MGTASHIQVLLMHLQPGDSTSRRSCQVIIKLYSSNISQDKILSGIGSLLLQDTENTGYREYRIQRMQDTENTGYRKYRIQTIQDTENTGYRKDRIQKIQDRENTEYRGYIQDT